ncbi:type III effector protein with ppr repeats [Ralstonia solanacearum]|uniref:type III effector protein with ppr repeats n=1 Tax=Ralstonia solanacearum TaxID=305 RepID=UPI0004B18239|nr:type III effector protein with ppr repeats [Ralstonia solanacearum]MCL9843950.1 hypothetical protein [Ralstonia solanacearum]MCL9848580.1 hypothetical protein [Ralstonia solanacearum]MCL9855648.1 hypothetical protein [Ralstonia solanacearum]MCL9857973.1 hypothetical protein [Ralstonia solanacearum]MCL9862710.1 hypothetical protein [Ralstonia solanacearum]
MWRSNVGDQRLRLTPDLQQEPASGQAPVQRSDGSRGARSHDDVLAPLAANRWSAPGSASHAGFRRSKAPLPMRPEQADGGAQAPFQVCDPRSNAAAIATYAEGGCPADEVLKLTTSLLRLGGDFTRSMELLQAVKDAGICPNVVTYSAAISACEKAGRMDEALVLLNELKAMGSDDPMMRPNVVTYSAAISACEKAGRADHALVLLGELKVLAGHDPTMRPNVVTYSAAISACEKAGWADHALALLDELRVQAGCDEALRPNAITYSAAISACMKAEKADRAWELIAEAIQDGVVLADAGYDAQANSLDFHANHVFCAPPPSSRPAGVPAPVARALLGYHRARGHLTGATQYIVGQHGGDAVKRVILDALNSARPRAYVVSPTNAGVLVPTAPNLRLAWSDDGGEQAQPPASNALADHLQAMWPQPGPSDAADSDAMSIDSASDSSPDEYENYTVIMVTDPNARARERAALAQRVREAETLEDVRALISEAEASQADIPQRYPPPSAAQLSQACTPSGDNIRSHYGSLRDLVWRSHDAAMAWQSVADHYWAARGASLGLGLPADSIASLETAAAASEARAARLEITQAVTDAIWRFKAWWPSFNSGNVYEIRSVLESLERASLLCNADALAALPLRDGPIHEFDAQLDILRRDAVELSRPGSGASIVYDLPFLTLTERAAARASAVAMSARIVQTIERLSPALKGNMSAVAAPVPMSVDEPASPEPADNLALIELFAHLEPTIEHARHLAVRSRLEVEHAADNHVSAFGLWHDAALAFDKARQALESVAAAGWPSQALSVPEMLALREEIREGYEAAVGSMQDAAGRVFSAAWEQVRDCLGRARGASGMATQLERVSARPELRKRLIAGCERMLGLVAQSFFAQRAGDSNAARVAAPFASLQAFLKVAGTPVPEALPAAAELQQIATEAERAGAGAVPAVRSALRELSTFCKGLRMERLRAACDSERSEVVALCAGASRDIWQAAARIEHSLRALVDPKRVAGHGGTSADTAAEPSDAEMAAAADSAAQRLEQRREGLLALPSDVPAALARQQGSSVLILRGVASAGHLTAQLIRCHEQAKHAMGEADLAQRAKVLRRIAAEVQTAGAKAGEVFVDTVTLGDTPGAASAHREAALVGAAVSRSERLAEYMRLCVQMLADLAAGQHNAQSRIRQPAGDARAYEREADAIQAIHDDLVDHLYEARERVVSLLEARHAASDTLEGGAEAEIGFVDELVDALEWRAILETDRVQRAWMHTTSDAVATRVDTTNRDVLLGMSGLLSKIEGDLQTSKDRLALYAEKTGDQAYPKTLTRENITLSVGLARTRTTLYERLTALRTTLQQERDAARAGASQARPPKRKGKEPKGKSKAK